LVTLENEGQVLARIVAVLVGSHGVSRASERRILVEVSAFDIEVVNEMAEVTQAPGNDVGDAVLLFHGAFDVQQPGIEQGRRWRRAVACQTMTLRLPVSSSRVTKVTPAAEPGRWRPVTSPATATGRLGSTWWMLSAVTQCRSCPRPRINASGWRSRDSPRLA